MFEGKERGFFCGKGRYKQQMENSYFLFFLRGKKLEKK